MELMESSYKLWSFEGGFYTGTVTDKRDIRHVPTGGQMDLAEHGDPEPAEPKRGTEGIDPRGAGITRGVTMYQ